jgi:hypothetical protein
MQLEVRQVIQYHLPHRYPGIDRCYPNISQFLRIEIHYDMNKVLVGVSPYFDQVVPVFRLVVLNGDPPVVVAKMAVIRKDHRIGLVLKVDDPVGIVGGRIHHVTYYLPDVAVLTVTPEADGFGWKSQQPGFPFGNQAQQFVVDGSEIVHNDEFWNKVVILNQTTLKYRVKGGVLMSVSLGPM